MKVYTTRMEFIKKYVINKEVLNVGCVGTASYEFLQKEISKIAKNVIGVDIDKKGLEKLKKMGYNVIYGDVQNPSFNLRKKFDVIVAGEIIEHLENAGIFLENMRKHLKNDKLLLLTTPNAREISYHLKRIFGRIKDEKEFMDKTHVCMYSKQTITQLLERYNFKIIEFAYLDMYVKNKKRILIKLIQKKFPDFSEGLLIASQAKS